MYQPNAEYLKQCNKEHALIIKAMLLCPPLCSPDFHAEYQKALSIVGAPDSMKCSCLECKPKP